jgi:hypothetical protein
VAAAARAVSFSFPVIAPTGLTTGLTIQHGL